MTKTAKVDINCKLIKNFKMSHEEGPQGPEDENIVNDGTKGGKLINLFREPKPAEPVDVSQPGGAAAWMADLDDVQLRILTMRGHLAPPGRDEPLPFREGVTESRRVEGFGHQGPAITSLAAIEKGAIAGLSGGGRIPAPIKAPARAKITSETAYFLADVLHGKLRELAARHRFVNDDNAFKILRIDLELEMDRVLFQSGSVDLDHLQEIYDAVVEFVARIPGVYPGVLSFPVQGKAARPGADFDLPSTFEEFAAINQSTNKVAENRDAIEAAAELVILGEIPVDEVVLGYRLKVQEVIIRTIGQHNALYEDADELIGNIPFRDLLELLKLSDEQLVGDDADIAEMILTTRESLRDELDEASRARMAAPALS